MKQLLIFPLVLLLFSCGSGSRKSKDTADKPQTNEDSLAVVKVIAEYADFLNGLDHNKMETITAATEEYKMRFSELDQHTRDSAFTLFDAFYKALAISLESVDSGDTTNYMAMYIWDSLGNQLPAPAYLKPKIDRLKRHGFFMDMSEGITYINQDRDYIEKHFFQFLSPDMKEFQKQLNREIKQRLSEDAGIVLSAKQFVDRLMWYDHFIGEHPDFMQICAVKQNRGLYLDVFLHGMDNTPLMGYEDNMLDSYFKEAYTDLNKRYPKSVTNKWVQPYFKALLTGNKKKADQLIQKYRDEGYLGDLDCTAS